MAIGGDDTKLRRAKRDDGFTSRVVLLLLGVPACGFHSQQHYQSANASHNHLLAGAMPDLPDVNVSTQRISVLGDKSHTYDNQYQDYRSSEMSTQGDGLSGGSVSRMRYTGPSPNALP